MTKHVLSDIFFVHPSWSVASFGAAIGPWVKLLGWFLLVTRMAASLATAGLTWQKAKATYTLFFFPNLLSSLAVQAPMSLDPSGISAVAARAFAPAATRMAVRQVRPEDSGPAIGSSEVVSPELADAFNFTLASEPGLTQEAGPSGLGGGLILMGITQTACAMRRSFMSYDGFLLRWAAFLKAAAAAAAAVSFRLRICPTTRVCLGFAPACPTAGNRVCLFGRCGLRDFSRNHRFCRAGLCKACDVFAPIPGVWIERLHILFTQ